MTLVKKHQRVPGDGTRYIRIIGRQMHPHGPGGCIPRYILYRKKGSQDANLAITRSIVAGEEVHVL